MFIVIAYDIVDDRRRNKIAKELENWGRRVQYSIFECELDAAQLATLQERLQPHIADEDSVRIYQLCQNCLGKSVAIGGSNFATDQDFYQV